MYLRRLPFVLALSAAALIAVPAVTALAGGNPAKAKKDSQISLVRPDPAPDPDAKGELRIRSKNNSERFDVHVEKVPADQQLDLFIEDPGNSASMAFVAGLDLKGKGHVLSLDTKKGDSLPLGVASLDDLIGRHVEVRAGADAILLGVVPPWDLSSKPVKASVKVTAPDGAPAPDMQGTLALRSKADKGQERIDLKLHKVPWASGPFHVFVEDPASSNTFTQVGMLDKVGQTNGRYRRDTKKGDALPLGVAFVTELSGRTLQVRDDNGTVFVSVVIPTLH